MDEHRLTDTFIADQLSAIKPDLYMSSAIWCQCKVCLGCCHATSICNLPDDVSTVHTCCSSTSTAPKDDRGDAAGGSGRQPADPCASGSSSLTDLPLEEECSGTSRRLTVDSEEDGFSFNEDETESQEVRQHWTQGPIESQTLLVSHTHTLFHIWQMQPCFAVWSCLRDLKGILSFVQDAP